MASAPAGRGGWTTTTHDWSHDVDVEHLAEARGAAERLGDRLGTHLVLEVAAYADDEAQARGARGAVVIGVVGDWVEVADDGRGTDTRRDARGRPVRKPVMATRDVRFFDAEAPPLLPDGLPRRGMSIVSAISPLLLHENWRADGAWAQEYRFGIPREELREVPPTSRTGTTVSFRLPAGVRVGVDDVERLVAGFRWVSVTVRDSSQP